MAIRLTKEALECYILTCLSIKDLYGAQILQNVTLQVSIKNIALFEVLNTLLTEGKIAKKLIVQNGAPCDLYSITPLGKDYLNSLLQPK